MCIHIDLVSGRTLWGNGIQFKTSPIYEKLVYKGSADSFLSDLFKNLQISRHDDSKLNK